MLVRNPQRCSNKRWKKPPSAAATEFSFRGSLELTIWAHGDRTRANLILDDRRRSTPRMRIVYSCLKFGSLKNCAKLMKMEWYKWRETITLHLEIVLFEQRVGHSGNFFFKLHIKNLQIKAEFCPTPVFLGDGDVCDVQHAVRCPDNPGAKSEFPIPCLYQPAAC